MFEIFSGFWVVIMTRGMISVCGPWIVGPAECGEFTLLPRWYG